MKKQAQYNITFGGIGGQGIIKASELLGWASLYDGYHVKKSEIHGMSQRGGSVESHVRFGKQIYSPLIGPGEADFVLCFHADEHLRLSEFLRPGGVDLLEYLKKAEAMVTNPKTINTALMGVLSVFLPISESSWQRAIETVFAEKYQKENKEVFKNAKTLVH